MTIQSDRTPLDLFPSESDLGLSGLNATTGKTESAVAARRTVGPAVRPTRTRRQGDIADILATDTLGMTLWPFIKVAQGPLA